MEDKYGSCILLFGEIDTKEQIEFCKSLGMGLVFENLGEVCSSTLPTQQICIIFNGLWNLLRSKIKNVLLIFAQWCQIRINGSSYYI